MCVCENEMIIYIGTYLYLLLFSSASGAPALVNFGDEMAVYCYSKERLCQLEAGASLSGMYRKDLSL